MAEGVHVALHWFFDAAQQFHSSRSTARRLPASVRFRRRVSEPGGEAGELSERVRAHTQARGLYTGIFCADGPMARRRIEQGFQVVTPGNDATILKGGCLAQLSALGAAVAGGPGAGGY